MKRKVAIIVLCAFLPNCTFAPKGDIQPVAKSRVVVSERVGDTIDSEEREHFGLFLPEIRVGSVTYQYEEAVIYSIPGGGCEIRLATLSDTLLVVNKDPRAIDILRDYIDNYDIIAESRESFDVKWRIVDHDYVGLPITEREINTTKDYFIAEQKMVARSTNRKILFWSAAAGFLFGGAAFAVVLAADREFETSTQDEFGCGAALEKEMATWMVASCVSTGVWLTSTLVGALIGRAREKAIISKASGIEDSTIIDIIKDQRMPRVLRSNR